MLKLTADQFTKKVNNWTILLCGTAKDFLFLWVNFSQIINMILWNFNKFVIFLWTLVHLYSQKDKENPLHNTQQLCK